MERSEIIKKLCNKFIRKILQVSDKDFQEKNVDERKTKVKRTNSFQHSNSENISVLRHPIPSFSSPFMSENFWNSTPKVELKSAQARKPVTRKLKKFQPPNNKPFVRHPLSAGLDYRMVRAAFYYNYEEAKLKKKKASHPSLEHLMVRKPFFPNFRDPVPPNHSLDKFIRPPSPVQSDENISCSNRQMTPESDDKQFVDENAAISVDRDTRVLLMIYFDDLCPNTIFKARGCLLEGCINSHMIPSVKSFESQLLKNTMTDAEKVYKYLWSFPAALRDIYLPAFARIYAERKQTEELKKLVRDFPKYGIIVDEMERNGWKRSDAVRFVIDHHTDPELGREEILKLICTTGVDVVKFCNYLQDKK